MEEGHSFQNLSLLGSNPPQGSDITTGQRAGGQKPAHAFRISYAGPTHSKGEAETNNMHLTVPCPVQGKVMLAMNDMRWHQIKWNDG